MSPVAADDRARLCGEPATRKKGIGKNYDNKQANKLRA